MISEDWLIKLNQQFRKEGLSQNQRPLEAIRRYSKEFEVNDILSPNIPSSKIFEWFKEHSKPGTQQVQVFKSVYFFDTQFWPLSIPTGYGTVKLDILESLDQIPSSIKTEIFSDKKQAWDYVLFWANCADYGLGLSDLWITTGLDNFGIQLLKSGDQDLRTAISCLNNPYPDPSTINSIRMAVEKYLKAGIAFKKDFSDQQAKKIGHDLNKGLDELIKASGQTHWEIFKEKLLTFPNINDRYKVQRYTSEQLWNYFCIAQTLGSYIVRELTDRNMLQVVLDSNKPPD